MVKDNLKKVRDRIKVAADRAGRDPSGIILLCVIKGAGCEQVNEAVRSGVTDIGENRVQDAVRKYPMIESAGHSPRWHFIGHLQTNKAKKSVEIFDLIHSVDSLRLAEEIQRQAEARNKIQSVLAQVNVSAERSKYGMPPEGLDGFIKGIGAMKNLMLLGLMTIAPYSDNPEDSRPYFRRLRELRDVSRRHNSDNIDIKHLSMGMSSDFEVAISEGADIVRIGSAIFR